MAIDVTTFLIEFPEFQDAPPALLSATLTRAIALTPDVVWGGDGAKESLTEQGTLVRMAWLLAQSPFARKMAMAKDANGNPYTQRLDELKRMVTSGNRVT